MNIIADNTIPYLKGVIEPIAHVTYLNSGQFTADAVREADVLIVRSVDKCSREILEGSRVKLITTATIGFDHIDTAYCEEAGIRWTNAPGCNAESVAEYLLASLFVLSLRTGESLQGKTIGIIGVGHVGKAVEKLCRSVGMHILKNDPPRAEAEGDEGFVSLQTIAEESDIITMHTPLTKTGKHPTYHLADKAFFQSLQKQPWLINAARGAIFDTMALLEAKKVGKVGQLIIDCWENEPRINSELLHLSAIATPHIAGFSADGKANATRMCLEEISRFFKVTIDRLSAVSPAPPRNPVIDLKTFSSDRIEKAIFSSFNPEQIDALLRANPEKFEWFRANYSYPREFTAYQIINATKEEQALLQEIGFQV
ncbi:4-phosphoerythronate dehydrogenase PdxB [Parabacteroides sp. OttesenSCG-928-G21]|nr:4-phosphoerythronate dehydrogenase PdxB [Parabacteroides sp. OttesenSCG-928-G21]